MKYTKIYIEAFLEYNKNYFKDEGKNPIFHILSLDKHNDISVKECGIGQMMGEGRKLTKRELTVDCLDPKLLAFVAFGKKRVIKKDDPEIIEKLLEIDPEDHSAMSDFVHSIKPGQYGAKDINVIICMLYEKGKEHPILHVTEIDKEVSINEKGEIVENTVFNSSFQPEGGDMKEDPNIRSIVDYIFDDK